MTKRLPVPALAQTVQRYLEAVRPLSTDAEMVVAEREAADFLAGDGARCQAELERFADEQDVIGQNWMSSDWLAGYLNTAAPVTLSTNFGAQIAWPRQGDGYAQAADLVTRIAAVHLTYLRGETVPPRSARGDELDLRQWRYLAGGIRHPRYDGAVLKEASASASRREVVVLYRGNAFTLRVSDDSGYPVAAAAVSAALRKLVEEVDPPESGFTDPAYLGVQDAAVVLEELLADADNRTSYHRLVGALFVVDLDPRPGTTTEHLCRTAFERRRGWPLKSTSYRVNLADGWCGVLIEHSVPDGGTVDEVVARALASPSPVGGTGALEPEPLRWNLSDDLTDRLAGLNARYDEQAAHYAVDLVTVSFHVPEGFKLGLDGAMQWVMLYAQLAVYGRVRSTYESVSMTEYRAGRTECLRPVTMQAVSLVRGLLDGSATPQDLEAARAAHSAGVVACKTGQAVDRHLSGLRATAERLGLPTPAVFTGEGYRRLTTDFLSTTSLGGRSGIVRYVFAPTSDGGMGVNYTPVAGVDGTTFEFCVTHREDVTEFLRALADGARALEALVERAAR